MSDGPTELLILGRGRSGSNLLCALLRGLAGHASFFELFDPGACRSITDLSQVHHLMQDRLGFAFASTHDPALLQHIAADPVNFWDQMTGVASDLGYRSLSCKIFDVHIDDANLDRLLVRPNLRLFFLSRRRVDPYISRVKADVTDSFLFNDTTDLLVEANLKDFLNRAFGHDRFLERAYNRAQQLGVPSAVIAYETYLDVEPALRLRRIEGALRFVGFQSPEIKTTKLDWLRKQDGSATWQAKLSNSLQFGAALAGLGLTDYAEADPLSDLVQPKWQDVAGVQVPPFKRDESVLQNYVTFRLLSRDPIITFTSIELARSPFAQWMAGPNPAFGARRGLHFLRPTWSMEAISLKALAADIRTAEQDNPGHIFAALSASKTETESYFAHGIRSIPGNGSIFEDESRWTIPPPPHPDLPDSDALYIARFSDYKNHHLTSSVHAPLFVYSAAGQQDFEATATRFMDLYPSAVFVNHLVGHGAYQLLDPGTVASTMARARTALALSEVEGFMRASIQCLMAGLPVVSVPSVGGRDAFYCDDNSLIVASDPTAVAEGVMAMIARCLSRAEVRLATLKLLRDARMEFETAANKLAADHLGPDAQTIETKQLFGLTHRYARLTELIGALNDQV